MVIASSGLEAVTKLDESRGEGPTVLDDGLCVLLEAGVGGLFERDGDGRNGIVVRPALARREHGIIDATLDARILVFPEKN
jgi:hypothetical protein